MPAADDALRPARSGAVCITCQHFRYELGRHCVTVLTCPIHQGLIPQGEQTQLEVSSVQVLHHAACCVFRHRLDC